uniref:hypothetical protein n=1 Tax=Fluviicola sp. TaxID=1917219 RepID=UPI0031D38FE5
QSEPYQFTIFEPKDPTPNFYPVAFKNDGQTYSVVNDQIGLVSDEIGELKLTIQVYKNGQLVKKALLKEYTQGEEEEEGTQQPEVSKSGNGKRFFILNIGALDLQSGYYTVVWTPRNTKSFTFNFRKN